jgi:hypothetical protein
MEEEKDRPQKDTVQIGPTIPREVFEMLQSIARRNNQSVASAATKWLLDRFRQELTRPQDGDGKSEEDTPERRRLADRRTLAFPPRGKSGGAR